MTIRTFSELRANVPINTVAAISAQDINDLVDTTEENVTQRVSAKTGSYTAVIGDNRTLFTMDDATANTFTVPATAPVGWECAVLQIGVGQTAIAVAGSGSQNLRHPDAHTKIGGQYGLVYLRVFANTGTAPQVVITGDTAL